jgi:hypothetical protein
MEIEEKEVTTVYHLLDGLVRYKVIHRQVNAPGKSWDGETWRVFGSHGIHTYGRECDPDKSTYKRVVATVVEKLRSS